MPWWQISDSKKRLDEEQGMIESFEDAKKKLARDNEALQQRVEALTQENDKLNKSKRNIQAEVCSFTVIELCLTEIHYSPS